MREKRPQLDLLETPIPGARRDDPETSVNAARLAGAGPPDRPSPSATQRLRILQILRQYPNGLNFSEIDTRAGWDQYVSNRRLKELRLLGLIEQLDHKRLTLRGRPAFVHRITPAGLHYLAERGL